MDTFEFITHGNAAAFVLKTYGDTIRRALFDGEGCIPVPGAGRGMLLRFAYPDGHGLVRRYLRGGLIRRVVKDAYLLNRPRREFDVHKWLLEEGLAVPRLLGACWFRRGPFVRGAIATEEIAATNLLDWLRGVPGDADATLRDCGALIRRMHDLGVWHADLQLRNLLITERGPFLIDFDNTRVRRSLSNRMRARNLLRFRRSFEKNGISLEYFQAICRGYGMETFPGWLFRLYAFKGRISDLLTGR